MRRQRNLHPAIELAYFVPAAAVSMLQLREMTKPKRRRKREVMAANPDEEITDDNIDDWYSDDDMRAAQKAGDKWLREEIGRGRVKPFRVSWFAPRAQQRVFFSKPIAAHTAKEAIKEVKALIGANDPQLRKLRQTPVNFRAEQMPMEQLQSANPHVSKRLAKKCFELEQALRRGDVELNPVSFASRRRDAIEAQHRAERADDAWQELLDDLHIDRYSKEAKGTPGSMLRRAYDNKVKADQLAHLAQDLLRAVTRANPKADTVPCKGLANNVTGKRRKCPYKSRVSSTRVLPICDKCLADLKVLQQSNPSEVWRVLVWREYDGKTLAQLDVRAANVNQAKRQAIKLAREQRLVSSADGRLRTDAVPPDRVKAINENVEHWMQTGKDKNPGKRVQCECGDPGCPVHKGTSNCPNLSSRKVFRSDMEDRSGTRMCNACADDAMDSGVFYEKNPTYDVDVIPNVRRQSLTIKALTHGGAVRKAKKQVGRRVASVSQIKVTRANPSDEARELALYISSDADLYRQQHLPGIKNLMRKRAAGKYDHNKAVKLFMYLTESGAKKYAKEYANAGEWHQMFPPAVRREAAESLVEDFEAEAETGNYDNFIPKKYQKKNPRAAFPFNCPSCGSDNLKLIYGTTRYSNFGDIVHTAAQCKKCKTKFGWSKIEGYKNIQPTKKNPGAPANIDNLAQMFHGTITGAELTVPVSEHHRHNKHIQRIGRLPYIKMHNRPQGQQHASPKHACKACAIFFPRRTSWVSMNGSKRIILAGEGVYNAGQRLYKMAIGENPRINGGEVNLGRIEVMAYVTPEKHSNSGQPILYYHPHAEETGRVRDMPSLHIDRNGMLYIPERSGNYGIDERGIIN
jgi:hypothetical protein